MRGRLSVLGWCLTLVAIAFSVMNIDDAVNADVFFGFLGPADNRRWALAIPLAAGLLALLRPRLAALTAPWALMLLGLFSILGRQAYLPYSMVFFDAAGYWLARAAGHADYAQLLVMPTVFLSVLAGARLAARDLAIRLRAAPRLRRLALPAASSPGWSLLLLPVAATAAALFQPRVVAYGNWAGPSPMRMAIWLLGSLAVALLIIRKSPGLAACLGTLGVLAFGFAGLHFQRVWVPEGWWRTIGYSRSALDLRFGWYSAQASAVQAAAFIGFGCWLAAQVWPEARGLLCPRSRAGLSSQVQQRTESSADAAAADLAQIERNRHEGARASLIALDMNLRAAERLIPASPDAAIALVAEARESSARALRDLRELACGVAHPSVLTDRGLADAVQALAADSPLRVETQIDLPGPMPAPVETACYFAVAEVLTNAEKHSKAQEAQICMSHSGSMLRIEVTDFGVGGADPAGGSGLAAAERLLATFDGILAISSPAGGPTIAIIEVPCVLAAT